MPNKMTIVEYWPTFVDKPEELRRRTVVFSDEEIKNIGWLKDKVNDNIDSLEIIHEKIQGYIRKKNVPYILALINYNDINGVKYIEKKISGQELKLGFRGKHVHFRWKPYSERSLEHQHDFDRLFSSIMVHGIKNPLIVFDNHVLIGMRRYEIKMKLNPDYVFDCLEIQENVNEWTRQDLPKIDYLKSLMEKVTY